MTNKQRAFALEYMVDMNATQAAIRAGYSPKTAKQQGHRLLTNVDFSSILETIEKTGTEADIAKEKEAKNTLLLTAKQEAFVREYCVDMNATQAAVRAGYSSRSAKQQGHRLLHNAGVLQTLQVKLNTKEIARKADAKQVIAHMKSIEFSNIFDYLELSGDFPVYRIDKITNAQGVAIKKVKFKKTTRDDGTEITELHIELHDKLRMLDKLDKLLNVFGKVKEEKPKEWVRIEVIYKEATLGDPDGEPTRH